MLHLSQNLKLIRLLSGKTQTEFGKPLNATKAMIVSYETGKAKPDELFLSRVSKMVGVSENDLLNRKLAEDDLEHKKVEKVENEDAGGMPTQSLRNDETYRSLVRTLENMSEDKIRSTSVVEKLAEDKIRSTAIIERLVALLERQFNYAPDVTTDAMQQENKTPAGDPFFEDAKLGSS